MAAEQYAIHVNWSDADQAFVADVPELPGCMADGSTRAEALAAAERAIGVWVETARELGRSIPEPRLLGADLVCYPSEGGGTCFLLTPGDRLTELPRFHRSLIGPAEDALHADMSGYLARLADRCPFSNMARWLRASRPPLLSIEECHWDRRVGRVGLSLGGDDIGSAVIGLPATFAPTWHPHGLTDFYRLVGFVDWTGMALAGKLDTAAAAHPLSDFSYLDVSAALEPTRTWVVGSSLCGDMLVVSDDDRAGWVCHESGRVRPLGTSADLIEWVFGELLANRTPEYDHAWARDEGTA